tara:strand:- start:176 stop:1468 length:1293 start_codon:yes stop_codon:yes gene_type:complete
MYKIKITIEDNEYMIEKPQLSQLSIEFIEKLELISKEKVVYKDIVIKSRTDNFNYKKETCRPIKNPYIDYKYRTSKDANGHYKHIKEQLELLKNNFNKEGFEFEYILEPEIWNTVSREKSEVEENIIIPYKKEEKRNLIYFGAPGTGKSFHIEETTKNQKVFRTMFHEEYSYFDFIGQYKPIVSEKSSQGNYLNARGKLIQSKEPIILYDYIAGCFIKSYIEAKSNPEENIYLIIEEINRGNCAAIFGDIFQLLDRDETHKSKYPISTTVELENYLKEYNIDNPDKLEIPSNLFVIATMNTSDQSLYPMDSAFKRRWNMKFVPINYNEENLKNTLIEGTEVKWLDFLYSINELIGEKLESENKMLGQWFVKAENNLIYEDDFKNKVLNYLYYDVFKHDRKAVFGEIQYSMIYNKNIKTILNVLMRKENNE